jgi:hypothetical protein
MFGEDGWCPSCGVPKREQCGSIVLQGKGLSSCGGAWVPNWQFDVLCLERSVASEIVARFDVELLEVAWKGVSRCEAMQIVVPSIGDAWFDQDSLRRAATAEHGVAGATCPDCGVWRWMPLAYDSMPPLLDTVDLRNHAIAASPEWFGDGWQAFRQIRMHRELAEMIVRASPKDFAIAEAH